MSDSRLLTDAAPFKIVMDTVWGATKVSKFKGVGLSKAKNLQCLYVLGDHMGTVLHMTMATPITTQEATLTLRSFFDCFEHEVVQKIRKPRTG